MLSVNILGINKEINPPIIHVGYINASTVSLPFSFFVNLRSLQITPSYYTIFAGGGITPDSVALDEWEETEIKASTLLNLIKIAK